MKMEDYQAVIAAHTELEFDDAAEIEVEGIKIMPEFRKFCEANTCGNYGKNYSCPPASGTPAEMEHRLRSFRHALVLRSSYAVRNAMDKEEAAPLKKQHNAKVRSLIRELNLAGALEEYLLVLGGPCTLCETCKLPEGRPCPFETERASCLSAYCIDVNELARRSKMEMSWSMDQISYFSILAF